jgi:hypothetical protein
MAHIHTNIRFSSRKLKYKALLVEQILLPNAAGIEENLQFMRASNNLWNEEENPVHYCYLLKITRRKNHLYTQ